LHAVKLLRETGVDVDYRILGGGPLANELVDLSAALGIDTVVTFEGRVDSRRVREALGEADLLLAPSITGPEGEQEGLPNSLKEAMATGVPTITTATGGIPELIEDGLTGYLVPEKDAASIAATITALARDWGAVAPVVDRARSKIESEYDLAQLSDDIENIYQELASRGQRT
jgi:colanic acid/amylovoran biosynthesis glycosyltransferase